MKIAIISTGDELLRGVVADTNAAWMAGRLFERGLRVERIEVVGDDMDALEGAFREAFSKYNLVFVGGGLGPTDDDLTAQAAAKAAGLALERRDDAVHSIREAFERIGRPMHEVNLKQADLPRGCRVLLNKKGTAPGFVLSVPSGTAYFFPGVPVELEAMFLDIEGELPSVAGGSRRRCVSCFGIGESDMQARLGPVAVRFPDIAFSYRASFPQNVLTLLGDDDERLDAVAREVRDTLEPRVLEVGPEPVSVPEVLGRALASRGATAATAESCTGGLIAHSLTEYAGASAYLRGGIVAYDNAVKLSALGVDPDDLHRYGAVSKPVVEQMARGVAANLGADWGLATSGIAGPDGGTAEKPVGLVHMAVFGPGGMRHQQRVFVGMNRTRVKKISAWTTMWMALRSLRNEEI